jgi:hypothetical protein
MTQGTRTLGALKRQLLSFIRFIQLVLTNSHSLSKYIAVYNSCNWMKV